MSFNSKAYLAHEESLQLNHNQNRLRTGKAIKHTPTWIEQQRANQQLIDQMGREAYLQAIKEDNDRNNEYREYLDK